MQTTNWFEVHHSRHWDPELTLSNPPGLKLLVWGINGWNLRKLRTWVFINSFSERPPAVFTCRQKILSKSHCLRRLFHSIPNELA